MRKKWIAALTVLGMVGGLAGINLLGAPSAQAYTPQSSCIVKSDLTLCALTTDYGLFDPGAQKGKAINNLLTANPFGLVNAGAGQYIYRGYYSPGDSGQGTGVVATLPESLPPFSPIPIPQAANVFAALVQSRHNDPNCGDDYADKADDPTNPNFCGDLKVEFLDVKLQQPGGPGIDVALAHVSATPHGSGTTIDQFNVGLQALRDEHPEHNTNILLLHFDNNVGCGLDLAGNPIGICNDRPGLGDVLTDLGIPGYVLGPFGPVLDPLNAAIGDGNGPLIPGTPTAIPYQPIPFLPVIPFLILP
jgi:hypothetical protein